MDNVESLADFIKVIDGEKLKATKRPKSLRDPRHIPQPYWSDEIKVLHKEKKFALVRYFRTMTMANLIIYKKLNAVFKRKIKLARRESFRTWAETLNPETPLKQIFTSYRRLNNYRLPNQSNVMFRNPTMVEYFLEKLCKRNSEDVHLGTASGNEPPFTMDELIQVLASKKDSAPGEDGFKYSTILKMPTRLKVKFLYLVNEVWSTQNVPREIKKILMVPIPKPGRDLSLLESHRPIALLLVYLKVINSMIKSRLENFIDVRKVFHENSYGFVKGILESSF